MFGRPLRNGFQRNQGNFHRWQATRYHTSNYHRTSRYAGHHAGRTPLIAVGCMGRVWAYGAYGGLWGVWGQTGRFRRMGVWGRRMGTDGTFSDIYPTVRVAVLRRLRVNRNT